MRGTGIPPCQPPRPAGSSGYRPALIAVGGTRGGLALGQCGALMSSPKLIVAG
jgi:hypothetical protein